VLGGRWRRKQVIDDDKISAGERCQRHARRRSAQCVARAV